MRSRVTYLAVLACGALLALALAPAVQADDAVVITAHQGIRIGGLSLEPGSYLLRAPSSVPTRNVVTVTSPDGETFYGFVLVIHESGNHVSSPTTRVILNEQDGFMAPNGVGSVCGRNECLRVRSGGEIDIEGGSECGGALDIDPTLVLRYNPVNGGQP